MNIRSAELLQNALEGAAQNEYRNRELAQQGQLARQQMAIMSAFRQAELDRYARMASRQEEFGEKSEAADQTRQILGEQNLAREQQQNAVARKQDALKTIMALNATGQLTPDGLKKVNQWLSSDPDFGKTGIQLAPPANPSTNPRLIHSALAQGLALRRNVQSAYDAEKDPLKKAELGRQLDDIDSYFQGKDAERMNDSGAATRGGAVPGPQLNRGKPGQAMSRPVNNPPGPSAAAQPAPTQTGAAPLSPW